VRHRKDSQAREREGTAPPMPSMPSDIQRGLSLPVLIVWPTSLDDGLNQSMYPPPDGSTPGGLAVSSREPLHNSTGAIKSLPPTPISPTADTSTAANMWKGIGDSQAGKNLSKSERYLNKASDLVGEWYKSLTPQLEN